MINISSDLKINIEEILVIQEQLKEKQQNTLGTIHNNQDLENFKQELENHISVIMSKYESKLHNYFKIKKKKERKEVLEQLIKNILDFLYTEINKKEPLNIPVFIKELHCVIFPNGIWGETMSASGQTYYLKYISGEYRKTKEFISVGGDATFFTKPEEIESAINNLTMKLFNNPSIDIPNKIIIFVLFFWKIHPFNDGNGTVAEILYTTLMVKSGYKVLDLNFKEYFISHETGLFYDKNNINYKNLFNDYYTYLNK